MIAPTSSQLGRNDWVLSVPSSSLQHIRSDRNKRNNNGHYVKIVSKMQSSATEVIHRLKHVIKGVDNILIKFGVCHLLELRWKCKGSLCYENIPVVNSNSSLHGPCATQQPLAIRLNLGSSFCHLASCGGGAGRRDNCNTARPGPLLVWSSTFSSAKWAYTKCPWFIEAG
jgi:hypothetical protein